MTGPLPELNVPTGASRFNTPAGNGFAKWFTDIKQGVDVLGVELLNRALAAAVSAANDVLEGKDVVTGKDSRLPIFISTLEHLIVFLDSQRRETWLGARVSDGGPTDWAMHHLNSRLGVAFASAPGYLAALTDSTKRMTDLAVRSTDGQVPDWVIERWAARIGPLLNITPSTVQEPSDLAVGASPALVPLLQSITSAAGRHADGATLPANPTTFTANGEQARLTFPATWSNTKPMPLIINFEGVGDASLDPRAAYKAPVQALGGIFAKCTFHGDSYGSPAAMADVRALYEQALRIAPISGVILIGNSMGGIAALNALTTGAVPNVLGVYLTDPTYDLRQRYDNGQKERITSGYGIAADGSDYATKTAGYDPALAPIEAFRGVPIRIIHSSGDTSVVLSLHGAKLMQKLEGHNDIELTDTGLPGHNTTDRFVAAYLTIFIIKCVGGPAGLPA